MAPLFISGVKKNVMIRGAVKKPRKKRVCKLKMEIRAAFKILEVDLTCPFIGKRTVNM